MLCRTSIFVLFNFLISLPVLGADFSAPLIESPKVDLPKKADAPIYIEVVVEDDNAVDTVKLYYRPVNSNEKYALTKMKLIKIDENKYFVELPASILNMKGIDYYVEARDVANNVSQEPFPSNPRKVLFERKKCGPNTFPCKALNQGSSWGASIGYGGYSVDDPDGEAGAASAPSVSIFKNYILTNTLNIWIDLNYQEFLLPYSPTEIGQDVRAAYIDTLLQWGTPLTDSRIWLGAGLGFGVNQIIDRATATNGVINQAYDDRSVTDFGYIIDAGYEVLLTKGSTIGFRGSVYRSSNFGVDRQSIGLYMTIN